MENYVLSTILIGVLIWIIYGLAKDNKVKSRYFIASDEYFMTNPLGECAHCNSKITHITENGYSIDGYSCSNCKTPLYWKLSDIAYRWTWFVKPKIRKDDF